MRRNESKRSSFQKVDKFYLCFQIKQFTAALSLSPSTKKKLSKILLVWVILYLRIPLSCHYQLLPLSCVTIFDNTRKHLVTQTSESTEPESKYKEEL